MPVFEKYYFKSKQKLLTTRMVVLPHEVGESPSPPLADIIPDQFDLAQYLQDAIDAGFISLSGAIIQQEIENQSTDTITVTINGGLLPPTDDAVVLIGPTGVLLKGSGAGKYTTNRVAEPNTLILDSAPFTPINFALLIWL